MNWPFLISLTVHPRPLTRLLVGAMPFIWTAFCSGTRLRTGLEGLYVFSSHKLAAGALDTAGYGRSIGGMRSLGLLD